MLNNLPSYIAIVFGITTLLVAGLLFLAIKNALTDTTKKKATLILFGMLVWLALQAFLALNGFYKDIHSTPPKMLLFALPPIATIFILFLTSSGRKFIDSLPLKILTWLHTSRIAVEIVLYFLFVHNAIPQLMTFEGRNFDIIAGITAPLIVSLGYKKQSLNQKIILVWNIICLLFVLNITINAVLSLPTPFQRFAFGQPNIAVLYFPFNWLPAFVVPVVIFSHLAAIRQLTRKNSR
jgi:hypothetical protein